MKPPDASGRVIIAGRVAEKLRRRAKVYAALNGVTLSDVLARALAEFVRAHPLFMSPAAEPPQMKRRRGR